MPSTTISGDIMRFATEVTEVSDNMKGITLLIEGDKVTHFAMKNLIFYGGSNRNDILV